jgi:hypothetical protein
VVAAVAGRAEVALAALWRFADVVGAKALEVAGTAGLKALAVLIIPDVAVLCKPCGRVCVACVMVIVIEEAVWAVREESGATAGAAGSGCKAHAAANAAAASTQPAAARTAFFLKKLEKRIALTH